MNAPKVTGISPYEGPPGTKITIRGENLGKSQKDLLGVTICGVDCLMYAEWISGSKILGRTRHGLQRGDVIVTTASGGKGTCTVQFRGFQEPIGPTIESAVWIDDSQFNISLSDQARSTSPQLTPDDPLGLLDEGNLEKCPDLELSKLFPNGSGNLLSPNFEPAWYLLENHYGTSFLDLKAGLKCLSRKVTQHKEGPLSFLKSNVMAIVDCLEILSTLQNWLIKDRQELGKDLVNKLEDNIIKSKLEAGDIFEDVLARKDKADAMRNALSVLQRFRFLFNLPANLEKSIQQGDYDVVVNDYARAKFLFHSTEVAVFQKVYQEVEQRIEKFRMLLIDNLRTLPSNVDEQKKLIRHLVNLETPGNPAWDCVANMHSWFLSNMNMCKERHLSKSIMPTSPMSDCSPDAPQVVQFVEEVSSFYELHFPEFWKLGQAYLHGDLFIKEQPNQNDQKSQSKQEVFQGMAQDTTLRLCNLIRAALLPHTLRNIPIQQIQNLGKWQKTQTGEALGSWMPHCIRYIRHCYSSLLKLDLSEETLNVVQLLLFDLRVYSMSSLFIQASEEVMNLHIRENWVVEMDDQNGGTTQLPLLFENRVVETLQLIRENVLQSGPKETDVFSQFHVQASMKQLSQSLLHAFAEALLTLSQAENREKRSSDSNANEEFDHENPLTEDQKLLIVLSNCNYTCKNVVPRLNESFKKHGYPDMSLVIKVAQAKYREVETLLFESYHKRKCVPLVEKMTMGLIDNKLNWKKGPKPQGVSVYLKEAIMNIIATHAEVVALTPPNMAKIMTKIIEATTEKITNLYETSGSTSRFGNIQATLDLRAIDETISSYSTSKTSKHLMVCRSKLEPFSDSKDRELVEQLLNQFRNHMRLQLLCFKEENIVTV